MKIFVNIIRRTITLDVDPTDSIQVVKQKIQEHKEGDVLEQYQRLIFAGRLMDDSLTLADHGIMQEFTLHLTVCLLLSRLFLALFF